MEWESATKVVSLFAPALGFTLWLSGKLGDKDRGAQNRAWMRLLLESQPLISRYRQMLGALSGLLERIYGDARSARALGVCLTIAAVYPLLFFAFGYALGGSNAVAGIELPPYDSHRRWMWPLGIVLFLGLEAVISMYRQEIDGWAKSTIERSARPGAARMKLGMGMAAATTALVVLASLALGGEWPSVYTPLAIIFAVAVAVAVPAAAAAAAACAVAFAAAFSLAIAFSLAFGLADAGMGATGDLGASFAAAACGFSVAFASAVGFSLAGAIALSLAFGSSVALFEFAGTGLSYHALVLFGIAFPTVNAVFDWISWRFSRHFIDEARRAERWTIPARDLVLDSGLALIFMIGLALVLPAVVDGVNSLSSSLGPDFYDWRTLAKRARDAPWSEGFVVTFMVVTTLIPTALHLVFALAALLVHFMPNNRLLDRLKRMEEPSETNGNEFDPLIAAGLVTAYSIGAIALLYVLCRGILWAVRWPIAQWLYELAIAAPSTWWLCLLVPILVLGRYQPRLSRDIASAFTAEVGQPE